MKKETVKDLREEVKKLKEEVESKNTKIKNLEIKILNLKWKDNLEQLAMIRINEEATIIDIQTQLEDISMNGFK
jgi:predicted  nucleic acid-binding Zn-ribbon protein